MVFNVAAIAGENKTLKADIHRTLSGISMVSKIVFGSKATPSGYNMDYPVNTIVDAQSGAVSYRVEWLLMRRDVGLREMRRCFAKGTMFRVTDLIFKDDYLELKLNVIGGDTARLKLLLGQGWQSRVDANAVNVQLGRIFNTLVPSAPIEMANAAKKPPASASSATSSPSIGMTTAAVTTPQADKLVSPAIPGRISKSDLQSVLSGFDSTESHALEPALKNAPTIARALNAARSRDGGSNGQMVTELEVRLGKNMQPNYLEDIKAMNEVYRQCKRFAQLNQAHDHNGRLLGRSASVDYVNLLLDESTSANLYHDTKKSIEEVTPNLVAIRKSRQRVLEAEKAFDDNSLLGAMDKLTSLDTDPAASNIESVRRYLTLTSPLRQDLRAYGELRDAAGQTSVLTEQLKFLVLGRSYISRTELPITKAFACQRFTSSSENLQARLKAIPDVPIGNIKRDPSSSAQGTVIASVTAALARVNQSIPELDSQITSASELRSLISVDLLESACSFLSESDALQLQHKAEHVKQAMALRASLDKDKSALEARLTELNVAEEQRQARIERGKPVMVKYGAELTLIRGNRYKTRQGLSQEIFEHKLHQIPESQYADRVHLYKAMEGLDGSTTAEALIHVRRAHIGKYYILQGDVFQIQADRNYPREGLKTFSVFGQVNLIGDYYVPVNVMCISAEKVPPYRIAPMLTKILDFRMGTNQAGKPIIIPVVKVIMVACRASGDGLDEIILNE